MGHLTEREMVAFFVGKKANLLRLASIAIKRQQGSGNYSDCTEYAVRIPLPQPITQKKSRNLTLFLYVKDSIVLGARISKHSILHYPDGFISGYEMAPTTADIALTAEILTYITR